jgi:hypothetical protein
MAITLLSAFINLMRSGFELSNLTALVFILLFACSWIYYSQNRSEIPAYTLQLLFWMSLILFSFSFFGFDSMAGISEDSIVTDAIRRGCPEVTNEISVIEYIRFTGWPVPATPHRSLFLALPVDRPGLPPEPEAFLSDMGCTPAFVIMLYCRVANSNGGTAPGQGMVLIERRKFVLPSLPSFCFHRDPFRYELLLLSEDTVFFQYISRCHQH